MPGALWLKLPVSGQTTVTIQGAMRITNLTYIEEYLDTNSPQLANLQYTFCNSVRLIIIIVIQYLLILEWRHLPIFGHLCDLSPLSVFHPASWYRPPGFLIFLVPIETHIDMKWYGFRDIGFLWNLKNVTLAPRKHHSPPHPSVNEEAANPGLPSWQRKEGLLLTKPLSPSGNKRFHFFSGLFSTKISDLYVARWPGTNHWLADLCA